MLVLLIRGKPPSADTYDPFDVDAFLFFFQSIVKFHTFIMGSFIRNLAVLLSVASASVRALPALNNGELSERATSSYVQDGDFSAPFAGNWVVSSSGTVSDGDITRVNAGGNFVAQIKQITTNKKCDEQPPAPGSTGYGNLAGTVQNVVAEQEFTISFQYKTLGPAALRNNFGVAMDNALRKEAASFTQRVKANQWYTYSETFKMFNKFEGNSTDFKLGWETCGEYPAFPTVQFDNFKISSS